jgi:hypothetical protein
VSVTAVLLPLLVEVALTFALLFWLGPSRVGAVRSGEVKPRDIVLGQRAWPERLLQIGNAFDNQFQLPVLFYVLTVLALVTRKADLLFVALAWIFVASRIVHAAIHTTSNDLSRRFFAFLAGAVVLTVMWLAFAAAILTGA